MHVICATVVGGPKATAGFKSFARWLGVDGKWRWRWR
jgi:hypothetical protein